MVDFVYEKKPKMQFPIRVMLLFFVGGGSLFLFLYTLATNYPAVAKKGDYYADDIEYSQFTFLYVTGGTGRSHGLTFIYDKKTKKELSAFSGRWHSGMQRGQSFSGGYIQHYESLAERPVFVFVEQDDDVILATDLGLKRLNSRKARLINQLKLFVSVFVVTLFISPFVIGKKLFYQIIHHIRN